MKMEQTECSETSEYKIQTPGNYPVENMQHTEHEEKFEIKNTRIYRILEYIPYSKFLSTSCSVELFDAFNLAFL
jgi:hypothetical protein